MAVPSNRSSSLLRPISSTTMPSTVARKRWRELTASFRSCHKALPAQAKPTAVSGFIDTMPGMKRLRISTCSTQPSNTVIGTAMPARISQRTATVWNCRGASTGLGSSLTPL